MAGFNSMLPPVNGADAESPFPEYVGSLMVRPGLSFSLCLGSPQEGKDTANQSSLRIKVWFCEGGLVLSKVFRRTRAHRYLRRRKQCLPCQGGISAVGPLTFLPFIPQEFSVMKMLIQAAGTWERQWQTHSEDISRGSWTQPARRQKGFL